MSLAPKIVYPCDHIIVDTTKEYGDILMTRNVIVGFPDKVPTNIEFIRIDELLNESKNTEYSPNVDYKQKVSINIIEWIDQNNNCPSVGQNYYIRGAYVKTVTRKSKSEICERCGNNGWYVDLFNSNDAETISGVAKLSQDFIKVLFTEKQADGYGSNITDILAENVYNEIELSLSISSSIQDVGDQIMRSQLEQINAGNAVSLEEALDSVEVKDIIFVREECTCYITTQVRNKLGKTVAFSFMVNN